MSSDPQKDEEIRLARGLGMNTACQIAAMKVIAVLGETLRELPDQELNKMLGIIEHNQSPATILSIKLLLPKILSADRPEIAKAFLEGFGICVARSGCDPVLLLRMRDKDGEELLKLLPGSLAASFKFVPRRKWTNEDFYNGKLLISWYSDDAVEAINSAAEQIIQAAKAERIRRREEQSQYSSRGR